MKIQSNSIRSVINEFQQEANPTEAAKITKEVLPESKNLQPAEQFATSIKSEQSFAAIMRTNELQSQLGKVNVEIKELMTEIEKVKQQEQEEKDGIKNQQDQENNILENLDKAADSYTSILDSTKLD